MRELKPYFVPPEGLVVMSTWELDGTPMPEFLEGWDPQTDLVMSSRLSVDLVEFLAAARLPERTDLRLTISWSSSTTGMSASLYSATLEPNQAYTVTLPGDRIGGTVQVRSAITLTDERQPAGVAEAFRAGSVLWDSVTAFRLDGDSAMFPIGIADFAGTPYGPHASWHLQSSDELDAPFLGTFLLLINTRDTLLVEAIDQKRPTALSMQLVSELEAGVAAVMVEQALLFEDVDLESYPDDSVGRVLGRYKQIAHSAGLTASLRAEDPSRFRSLVDSAIRAHGYGRIFE
ncbi:hypothetical protein [Herbiconiux daphne]|uniref:Uncharacterized protein n=1 Tax=Herbiconiux daphne TaxID=2970914 RepID=A0ABT2H1G4_9MICO|nr:hypothetical protein [Herbiconiux daphne]MCS5733776.1 hypothetical protein [Herbiconiux daphne]